MTFALGDNVKITNLRKHGVITAILNSESVTVQVDAISFRCKVSELELHSPSKRKLATKRSVKVIAPAINNSGAALESSSIDLHGKSVREALCALELALNDLLLRDGSRLEIIHGHGSGKVMRAVHEYLSASKVVQNFKIDPVNTGMTVAYL